MSKPDIIPEGYKQNAQGHLVPVSLISPLDMQRDELVRTIVDKARHLQFLLEAFKELVHDDINAHMQLSADEYDVQLGGEMGNLTLSTLDGSMAVKVAIDRPIFFDERIHSAKVLIDECLEEWSGDNANLKALIHDVFKTNSKGSLDAKRIMTLNKHKITDDRWLKAMRIINDSIDRTRTKQYIRFYERGGEENKLMQISLNFTAM